MNRRRIALAVAAATSVACALVAAVVVGRSGAFSALVAGVIVVVFFASTPVVLGPVARTSPGLSLLFAMIFFTTKVVALVALFVLLHRTAAGNATFDPRSLSITVIVTTLAWTVARIVDALRERTPTYDLPDDGGTAPDRFNAR